MNYTMNDDPHLMGNQTSNEPMQRSAKLIELLEREMFVCFFLFKFREAHPQNDTYYEKTRVPMPNDKSLSSPESKSRLESSGCVPMIKYTKPSIYNFIHKPFHSTKCITMNGTRQPHFENLDPNEK